MKAKYRKTLKAVFARPISANIKWREIEDLFQALGAEIEERKGSRVAVIFPNQPPGVFHRPHPSPNADKGAVAAVRDWLENMGIKP